MFCRLIFSSVFFLSVFSFAENLEQIPSSEFQNKVIRYEWLKNKAKDSTVTQIERSFAKAGILFFEENYESAREAYSDLLGKDSFLDSQILLRLAKIAFHQNDFSEMRKILKKADTVLTSESFENTSLFLRAQASLLDTNLNTKNKIDSLYAYLNRFKKGERANALRFIYAELNESVGNLKTAKKAYLQVIAANTKDANAAFLAVSKLRKESLKDETLQEKYAYMQLVCKNASPEECLQLIDSLLLLDSLSAPPKDTLLETNADSVLFYLPKSNFDLETRKSIWEKRAVAFRNLNRFDDSYRQFRFLIDSVEAKPLWMQSALKLLRKAPEQNAKEIAKLDSMLLATGTYGKESANNLWLRGFEFEQKKKYNKALECYRLLSTSKFKFSKHYQWAKFRMGLIYVKQQKYELAKQAFSEAKKLPYTWSSSASRMFLGDVYKALNKDSLAREAYLDCILDFPLGYYAHRSREKLQEFDLMPKEKIPFVNGKQLSYKETLDWIRGEQSKMRGTYSKEKFEEIKKLFNYGFSEEAIELFQTEFKKNKNAKRLDFLFEYGNLLLEMNEVALSYRLARAFQNHISRKSLANAPILVLRFLYPLPYKEQVFKYAGNRIDPLFVYSVMRQESIFDFLITSPAKACGLLQIMPATGQTLAELERIENFNKEMLYNPYLNIRLGTRYLIDLKQLYNDEYMYVLGNYNAGPNPTKRWQKAGTGLPLDIRVEDVSYAETRNYIKRVLGNYWIYQEIWQETLDKEN